MTRIIVALTLIGFGTAGGLAQSQPVEQIASASRYGGEVEQIGDSNGDSISETRPARSTLVPPTQLNMGATGQPQAQQLTNEGRSVRAPLQLYRGGRSAEPPTALSRPSEGRTSAVAPVGGNDRCDQAEDNKLTRAACAHVIETRSAEFKRPDPVALSPEERLLVEQRLREAPLGRRLTNTGRDPNSLEEQAVASLALRPAPDSDREEPKKDLSADEAAAAVIINAIVNGPGQKGPN